MKLYEYTVHELVEMLEKGEITSEEITRSYFDRIKEKDDKVKAYVSLLEEEAIAKAKEVAFIEGRGYMHFNHFVIEKLAKLEQLKRLE